MFPIAAVSSGAATASASIIYQIAPGVSAPYSSDSSYVSSGSIKTYSPTVSTSAVNNPAPASVYQTERNGGFTYTLPNLVVGQIYTVRLHFSENYLSGPGQRQFNVAINSIPVLSNFDIWAAAGAQNRAVVEAFPAAASSSGQILINFTGGAANIPKVSAVELVSGFRVSAGGPGASYWEADQSYNLGGVSYIANSITTSQTTDPAPTPVYQFNRFGWSTYTIHNLTAGATYAIRLHFAETVYSAVGKREFNVSINNTTVLTNYDVFAQSGGANTANVQDFSAMATSSGQIVVAMTPGDVDGPIFEGLEITGGGGSVVDSGQYKISGLVTLGGTGPSVGSGVSGITVSLSGSQSAVAVSGSDGSYSFIVNAGSYTISAASPRYYITGPLTVSNITANQPNQNFSALLLAGSNFAPTSPHIDYIFLNGSVVVIEHPH